MNNSNIQMSVNNSENEKLFSKSVPVSLKDGSKNQTRTCELIFTMEWQDATTGMYSRKMLAITLTDYTDPFFLYNLHLTEEDFNVLKSNQELLINFSSFPQHIIDYIEKCLQEDKSPQPKFLLVFTIDDKIGSISSQFDIVETNQFKLLTHLSLKFVSASEVAVRQYITTCFRNLKEKNMRLEGNLTVLERDRKDQLSAAKQALNTKDKELECLKSQSDAELTKRENQYSISLQEERNRLNNKLKEQESRFERERREKDLQFRKEIQQLESKNSALEELKEELQDKNHKLDKTIRELKSNAYILEDEIRKLKDDLQSFQLKSESLQSELKDKQDRINRLDEIIADLREEVANKSQIISKCNQRIEANSRRRKSLEDELEAVKNDLDVAEKSREMIHASKEELNGVVKSLQDRIKLLKRESELSEEKIKALEGEKRAAEDTQFNLQRAESQVKYLTDLKNALEVENRRLEDRCQENARMYRWLHKQATDNGIIPKPLASSLTSPTAIAQRELVRISTAQNMPSSDTSSPLFGSHRPTSKSVRLETVSPGIGKDNYTPHRFYDTNTAHLTSPSGYINQMEPDTPHVNHNENFDSKPDFDINAEAFSGAFGDSVKHSTAKKPTNPAKSTKPTKRSTVKSTIPKTVKK